MSRFLSQSAAEVAPYVPGEQPRGMEYIKLNTNENPYPPSPKVLDAIACFDAESLRLYPDPTAADFRAVIAGAYSLQPEQIFAGGGSDEVLAYAFMAFFDRGDRVYFPDITYGFYRVYAELFGLQANEIPLRGDFSVNIRDYFGLSGNLFLANPNAPTGMCLAVSQIEEILRQNPDRLLVLDEAYVDFSGGQSCIPLIDRYDNLLVVQTFSKSRGLAGMRLGAAFGNKALIAGLERIKYSFNPYNLDRVSLAAGIAAVADKVYMQEITAKIIQTREHTLERLADMGFAVLPSATNFLFARSDRISGGALYEQLKQRGVLVRHFNGARIRDFVRITVGTDAEMDVFLQKLEDIL